MGKNPAWYDKLPKWAQEAVDQTGHIAIGWASGLTFGYLYPWWRENIKQWPPGDPIFVDVDRENFRVTWVEDDNPMGVNYFPENRVWDKSKDELFYHIGYTLGGLTQAGLLLLGGFKLW